MSVNISEILSVPHAQRDYPALFMPDRLKLRRSSFRVSSKEDFVLHVAKDGNRYHITGQTEVKLIMPCDRCLTDVEIPFPVRIDRRVDLDAESDQDHDADELSFIDGCMLDTDRLVTDEIVVALPTKILCKEDCRGLCPRCGKNLNEGSCSCDQEAGDPRMARIADIFRDFNQ